MEKTFPVTIYDGLFELRPRHFDLGWEELAGRLGVHRRLPDKARGAGWGPYRAVAPPGGACDRHRGGVLEGPHRCDACVEEMSLAVFDVDVGTLAQVAACEERLQGITHLWYSSYSWHPDQERPSLRLVVPLARPVPATRWRSWRLAFLRTYAVPADAHKCSGLSHFYYLPACPVGVEPIVERHEGRFFDPDELPSQVELSPRQVAEHEEVWVRPAPVEVGDLTEQWTAVERYVEHHRRAKDREMRRRAGWLAALRKGEPLAEHGERNVAASRTAAVLAFLLPDESVEVLVAMMRGSVQAMIDAGSSLTVDEVERMVVSGLRKAHAAKAQDAAIRQYFDRHTAEIS